MKRIFFCVILLIGLGITLSATIILHQGFEGTQDDNWMYIADPVPNRQTWWGPTNQPLGGATAQSGIWYWGSRNLDNLNHSLSFDPVTLSKLNTYTISFYYYSSNLNSTSDSFRYCVEYDNGVDWNKWIYLEPNTNVWTLVTVDVPSYATTLRLRVEAEYEGLDKYLHWDNFSLDAVQIDPTAPYVYNVNAAQRTDGSKIVDIHYDMVDVNLDLATIDVLVSTDGGVTFGHSPLPENLVGDIGDNIGSGSAKHIVWHAGAEDIDFVGSQHRVRILADDHTFMGNVQTPRFNPVAGTYDNPIAVRIHCDTFGAEIHYSLDGSEPSLDSPQYTTPVLVSQSTALKARAFKDGWISSAVFNAEYVIIPAPPANFALVPGGTFTMGRTSGEGYGNELPTHPVTLPPFYVSKYEVTQQEYEAIMTNLPAQSGGVGPDKPVHRINWYQTLIYCNLRSVAEGLEPVYSISGTTNPAQWGAAPFEFNETWNAAMCNWNASGYRLLTEAEWEYAARGASNYPDYVYSGSNDPNLVAWHGGNSGGGVHPVGQKQPNSLGLYDMSGNVSEFNWDWLGNDYYSLSPLVFPTGPDSGSYRLGRGGSWTNTLQGVRISFRPSAGPHYTHNNIGFRVARKAASQ